MAFCTYCGNELSDSATACPKCGHPRGLSPVGAAEAAGPGGPAGMRRTDGTAIASLILGIAGLVACPLIPSILAVIFAQQSRQKIAADPALEGAGLAKAGLILGWIGIGVSLLLIAGAVAGIILAPSGGGPAPVIDFEAIGIN